VNVLPAAGTISFARGVPSPDMFPSTRLIEAGRRAIEIHGRIALNYGPPGGFGPLREWIAERHAVAPEQVVVTPGSLLGLRFLVEHLMRDGGRAIVEVPTYDRMLHLLRTVGASVETVPRGEVGLDLDALRARLSSGSAPRLLYAMPTFHNPSGRTMDDGERAALADLVAEHEVPVIEDDPYGLLRLDGEWPVHLHRLLLDRGAAEQAVLMSSFSKSIAPGLRVGYLVLPPSMAGAVEALATATYVSPPLLAQAQVFEFLSAGHLEPHLEDARAFLRPRRDALLEVLDAELDGRATWTRPDGGYFLWLDLHEDVDASALAERARGEAGVEVVPGRGFFAGDGGAHSLRLAFSFPAVDAIVVGARRLAALIRTSP
jgi:DNA-binding transcriptional MocR family regulator